MSKTKTNTPKFRAAFPNLFKARENKLSGKMEYSVVALFKKGEDLDELKKVATQALVEEFGPNKQKWPRKLKSPFKDQGDRVQIDDNGKETLPQGYERGAVYLDLKSQQKPGVVDQDVEPIIDQSEVYGGCYMVASVNAKAYNHGGNCGVSLYLNNVMKVGDGEPFGNRAKPEDDFKPAAGAGDDSDAGDSSSDDIFG